MRNETRRKAETKGFSAGIVYVAGWLCQYHGEDALAEQILSEVGLETETKCRRAGADGYDIECASPAFEHLRYRAALRRLRSLPNSGDRDGNGGGDA